MSSPTRLVWACVIAVGLGLPTAVWGRPAAEEAWSHYRAGRFQEAYDAFSRALRENPGDERVYLGLGLAAYRLGKLSHACFAFERLLAFNPGNQRARLELARTCFAMGEYEQAREEFEAVLASRPPPQVEANIRRFLTEMQHRQRRWDVDVQAGVSVFYDDNVNYGPSSKTIDTLLGEFEVATNSRPIEAWGVATHGALAGWYEVGRPGRWGLTAVVNGYRSWLEDAPDYEIGYVRGQVALRRVGRVALLEAPVRWDYLELGRDPLVTMWGTEPSVQWAPWPGWQSVTRVAVEYRDFDEGRDRDGVCYRAGETVRRFFGARRHELAATVAYWHEEARESGFANHGPGFVLSAELRPFRRIALYGSLEYRIADYRDELFEELQDDPRHDEQFQGMAGARWQPLGRWLLDISYRYVHNDSNFGLYEYERNIGTVSASVMF